MSSSVGSRFKGRRWNRLVFATALAVAFSGCGDDGGSEGSQDSPETPKSSEVAPRAELQNGRIVVLSADGKLSSVQPDGTDRREIAAPEIAVKGGPTRVLASGIAFFPSAGEEAQVVLVDAATATAREVGPVEGSYLGTSLKGSRDLGGGRRFVVFQNDSGIGGLLVDIEKRKGTGLADALDDETVAGFAISPDERFGVAGGRRESLIFPTEDPAKARAVKDVVGAFSSDGRTAFAETYPTGDVREAEVRLIRLDGDGEETLADEVELLRAAGNSALMRGKEGLFLTKKPGERRLVELDTRDHDLSASQIYSSDRALLEIRGEDEDQGSRWALVDESEATARQLPALDGLYVASPVGPRTLFATYSYSQLGEELEVPARLAVLDVETGDVTSPVEVVGVGGTVSEASLAPSGRFAVLSRFSEAGPPAVTVVQLQSGTLTDVVGGFVDWSPDGSALLVSRLVGEEAHLFVSSPDGQQVTDLGPGVGGVWTPA